MSCDDGSFGIIESANPALCSIFGRIRSEIVGQNVSMLIPPPFADKHQGWLRTYLTGQTVTKVVNYSRRVFGLHKNGTIFPMVLTVKQVTGGLSGTSFLGMVTADPVPNWEHFLFVNSTTGSILRCSGGCFPLLGIAPSDVGGSGVKLKELLPSLDFASDCSGVELELTCANQNTRNVTVFVKHFDLQVTVDGCALVRVVDNLESTGGNSSHGKSLLSSARERRHYEQQLAAGVYPVQEENAQDGDGDQLDHTPFTISIETDSKEVPDKHQVSKGRIDGRPAVRHVHLQGAPVPEDAKSVHAASVHGAASNASSARTCKSASGIILINLTPWFTGLFASYTASSAGYAMALDRIRGSLLSKSNKLEPSMFWLRTAVQLTFVVIIVMSVVGFVVMQSSVHSLDKSIADIASVSQLRDGLSGIRKTAQQLYFINRGYIDPSYEAMERRNLRYQAGNLSMLHENLYLGMKDMTPALQALYVQPIVAIESISGQTVLVTDQNLWQSLNSLIANAFLLHEVPLREISETQTNYFVRVAFCDSDCLSHTDSSTLPPQFIRANSHTKRKLWLTLRDLMDLYKDRAVENVNIVQTTQAILMAVALCTLSVVVLLLLPPSIRKVNQGRDVTLQVFLSLPVTRVREIATAKIQLLTQMGLAAEAAGMRLCFDFQQSERAC